MKVLKLAAIFLVCFFISFFMIKTFSQEPFRQEVGSNLFGFYTPVVPLYYYILGAFLTGFMLGLLMVVYYLILNTSEMMKKKKRIKELEDELENSHFHENTVRIPLHAMPKVDDASTNDKLNAL